jgi:glyoxylase-like metal-dependent hydrolase (beta-lactamase superfamily II)
MHRRVSCCFSSSRHELAVTSPGTETIVGPNSPTSRSKIIIALKIPTLKPVSSSSTSTRQPRQLLTNVYAFPPNRETLGATAYFIVEKDAKGNPANLLVDTPAWDETNRAFLTEHGGVRWWVFTHRGGQGAVATLQTTLQAEIVVQEQEAYLLPDVPGVQPFHRECRLGEQAEVQWTPGHSPGSSCLYYRRHGGLLFTGRHLLPTPEGTIQPLRFSKTFHWPRQLEQVRRLQAAFTPETLAYLCPGANTGFLRGQRLVTNGWERLQGIDTDALRSQTLLL